MTTHCSSLRGKRSARPIEGSATFTIVMSRITMNWATASTASTVHDWRMPAAGRTVGVADIEILQADSDFTVLYT